MEDEVTQIQREEENMAVTSEKVITQWKTLSETPGVWDIFVTKLVEV